MSNIVLNNKKSEKGKKKKAGKQKKAPVIHGECALEGCSNLVVGNRRIYCSPTCRAKHEALIIKAQGKQQYGEVSKYKLEYAKEKLDDYLNECLEASKPNYVPTSSSFFKMQGAQLPTKERYARFLGFSPRILAAWERSHLEFAEAMEYLMEVQKDLLMNGGLAGHFNPAIVAMLLNVNHSVIPETKQTTKHEMLGVVKHFYAKVDELESNESTKIHEHTPEQLGPGDAE